MTVIASIFKSLNPCILKDAALSPFYRWGNWTREVNLPYTTSKWQSKIQALAGHAVISANLIRENYAWEEPELDSIMVKTTGCGVIQTELESQL